MSDESLSGEPNFTYSRAHAIADGVLVDAGALPREAGIQFPVALTRAAWDAAVALTDAARALGQYETGRLWDVLWMFAVYARRAKKDRMTFDVLVVTNDVTAEPVSLQGVCGPGDAGEPVVTIMLPHES